jgi:hypothetical protein
MPIEQIGDIYLRWKSLRALDQELAPGWAHLHAARRADLE